MGKYAKNKSKIKKTAERLIALRRKLFDDQHSLDQYVLLWIVSNV